MFETGTKHLSQNERFVSSAINSAKTAAHDLTKDDRTKSTDDDFGGTT